MTAKTFTDLEVWQHAHTLVLDTYRLTEVFPKHEVFGLTSQLRRAAISVPANIAEGFRKTGVADRLRYYNISQGSLEECHYYFILAEDSGYGSTVDLLHQYDTVARLLYRFRESHNRPVNPQLITHYSKPI